MFAKLFLTEPRFNESMITIRRWSTVKPFIATPNYALGAKLLYYEVAKAPYGAFAKYISKRFLFMLWFNGSCKVLQPSIFDLSIDSVK